MPGMMRVWGASQASEGARLCHSVACSYACAKLSTAASPPIGPVSCMPIGSPLPVNPHGIEIVGKPSTLNGRVLRSIKSSPESDEKKR